ncbi:hypothetical protein F2Q69_00024235 [Brassica cretica]|uniref:Uncharacterized protein n=1 Tax=Brassica cretica TaxID=69181 RepID=A0A8S9QGZ2_BRACR|nr:hypothetical protein F2Q69_00024235 [Brassica cretica]
MDARLLRSDRAWLELGPYVATERNGRSALRSDQAWLELGRYVGTGQRASAVVAIKTKLYLGNIRCDVFLTEHDLLRKDILVFCGDLDVNFVVTVFDPNKGSEPEFSQQEPRGQCPSRGLDDFSQPVCPLFLDFVLELGE